MKSIPRRPSPALVIACIALFVSLGGVSYGLATGSIDSRELKNNAVRSKDVRNNTLRTFDIRNSEVRGFDIRNSTIQGRDVAFNTLTGADISEPSLGKVPSATAADSATTATTAGSVAGVTPAPFAFAGEVGGAFVDVLDRGGLRVSARCVAGPDIELVATTTVANSEVDSSFLPVADADFDPGDSIPLTSAATTSETGSIVFAGADGRVVTLEGLIREDPNDVRGTTNDCGFFGIAHSG